MAFPLHYASARGLGRLVVRERNRTIKLSFWPVEFKNIEIQILYECQYKHRLFGCVWLEMQTKKGVEYEK